MLSQNAYFQQSVDVYRLLTGFCGVPVHGESGVGHVVIRAEPHVEPVVGGDDVSSPGRLSPAEPTQHRRHDVGAVIQLSVRGREEIITPVYNIPLPSHDLYKTQIWKRARLILGLESNQ